MRVDAAQWPQDLVIAVLLSPGNPHSGVTGWAVLANVWWGLERYAIMEAANPYSA
jgi:hypothetical protein